MRIAVLELGLAPPDLMQGLPSFGQELSGWAARAMPGAQLDLIDIAGGAAFPDLQPYQGVVISGSEFGVYDDTPWMEPLRDVLITARAAGKPMVGVCFGHQIMAETFGGRVEKVGAPHVGVRRFRFGGGEVPAHVWHQDQVTSVPSGANVIASAEYCPVAGLAYQDFPAVSVQFHPEYRAAFLGEFLRRGRGKVLDVPTADRALTEIAAHDVRHDLFAEEAGQILRGDRLRLTQVKAESPYGSA